MTKSVPILCFVLFSCFLLVLRHPREFDDVQRCVSTQSFDSDSLSREILFHGSADDVINTDVITPASRTCTFHLLGSSCACMKDLYACKKDLRPISILPVLSKVYEQLIFCQLSVFINKNNVLNNNISANRKGQSTTNVLQAIRDDIVKAMKRSEVIMMILADFSKAFDTICFTNLISKMSKLGFPRDFLIWTLNYIAHHKQFVQIDDTCSKVKNVNFGVP